MPIYDKDDRAAFMADRRVPFGIKAWLGPAGGPKWRTGFYRYVSGAWLTRAPPGALVETKIHETRVQSPQRNVGHRGVHCSHHRYYLFEAVRNSSGTFPQDWSQFGPCMIAASAGIPTLR